MCLAKLHEDTCVVLTGPCASTHDWGFEPQQHDIFIVGTSAGPLLPSDPLFAQTLKRAYSRHPARLQPHFTCEVTDPVFQSHQTLPQRCCVEIDFLVSLATEPMSETMSGHILSMHSRTIQLVAARRHACA